MKSRFRSVLLVAAVLLISASVYAGGIQLKYKFKAPENTRYKWNQTQEVTMKGMPMPPGQQPQPGAKPGEMNIKMSSKGVLKYSTDEVLEGGKKAKITVSFEEFKTQSNMPGAPTSQMDAMVKQMQFHFTMDNKGKVSDMQVSGFSDPSGSNDFIESIKNSVVKASPVLPDKDIKKGLTWDVDSSSDIALPMGGKTTIKTHVVYKVAKITKWHGHKAVFLKQTADITVDSPKDPGIGKQMMTGSGKFEGETIFLYDLGKMGKSSMKGKQTLTIDMPIGMNPDNTPRNAKITQEINLSSDVELIEYK